MSYYCTVNSLHFVLGWWPESIKIFAVFVLYLGHNETTPIPSTGIVFETLKHQAPT